MKFADIEVGREYALAVGKRSTFSRAVIVDVDKCYENKMWNSYSSDPTSTIRPVREIPARSQAANARRFLVAIAIPVQLHIDKDPETGEPWKLHDDRSYGGIHYLVDWLWIPYAARSADIRAPWNQATHGWSYLRTYDEAVALGRAHDQEFLAQQKKNAERAAAAKITQAEKAKVLAANREFYETRVEPSLIEAGLDSSEFRWDGRGENDRVEIDPVALARILGREQP